MAVAMDSDPVVVDLLSSGEPVCRDERRTREGLVPQLKIDHEGLEQLTDIMPICKLAMEVLQELSVHQLFSVDEFMETRRQFEEQEVFITVSGCQNCGKSTLLNALFGFQILPVKCSSETGIRVIIQHDEAIHRHTTRCPCVGGGSECDQAQVSSCPRLSLGNSVVRGVKAIHDKLKELNRAVRRGFEVQECVLTLNVQVLAKAPLSWRVSLVDTPGFGENNPVTTQVADRALKSSSAHLYVVNMGSLNSTVDAKYYRELEDKDQGAFNENRLAVVVTKFDTVYDDEQEDVPGEMKTLASDSISCATEAKISIPSDAIFLVSGMWGVTARLMKSCSPAQESGIHEKAIDCLSKYPGCPSGQGESKRESLKSLTSSEVAMKLEDASGIALLETRIKDMSAVCVDIWLGKMCRDFQKYLTHAAAGLENQQRWLKKLAEENQEKLERDFESHYKVINETRRFMEEKLEEQSAKFAKAYDKDLMARPQDEGKALVPELVDNFKEKCTQKIKDPNKHFGPTELNEKLERFLKATEIRLNQVLNRACKFPHSQRALIQGLDFLSTSCTIIRSHASLMCGDTLLSPTRSDDDDEGLLSSMRLEPPSLADVKRKADIPPVTLSRWQQFKRWWSQVLQSLVGEDTDNPADECEPSTYRVEDIPMVMDELELNKKRICEQCEQYFKEIKTHVVKYYVQLYCQERDDKLKALDENFKAKLAQKETEMAELREAIKWEKDAARRLEEQYTYLRALGRAFPTSHKF